MMSVTVLPCPSRLRQHQVQKLSISGEFRHWGLLKAIRQFSGASFALKRCGRDCKSRPAKFYHNLFLS